MSRCCRGKLIALALAAPIVITSATGAKAVTPYEVWLPLQKEAIHEIDGTLQLRSTPIVFTCFEILEILAVLAGVGIITRSGYQLISEFFVSRTQMGVQKNLSKHNLVTEVEETKVAKK